MTKSRLWLLVGLGLLLLIVAGLLSPSLFFSPSIVPTPSLVSTPTIIPSLTQGVVATWDVSKLPPVTPPAPGEPTLPPEALAMHAAPTATPSPIAQPTDTLAPTATSTPVLATGSDDVPMVEIRAGEFIMGESYERAQVRYLTWRQAPYAYWHELKTDFANETPRLIVDLPTFAIDQFQVTIARFRACVQAGICNLPMNTSLHPLPIDPNDPQYDNYPAIGVPWSSAVAYCQWVGKRLPREAEWEKAARGTDGRSYPWGNTWNSSFVSEELEPVGSHPQGASPSGTQDMLGPVLEWTADFYTPYPGNKSDESPSTVRSVRGASILTETLAHVSVRDGQPPDEPVRAIRWIGFRCARGQTPPPTLAETLVRAEVIQTPASIATVDLSRMAEVPAGEFIMGTDAPSFPESTYPARRIYLDGFYIDKHEVTNAEYAEFLNLLNGNYLACEGFTCAVVKQPGEVPNGHLMLVHDRYASDPGFEKYPVTYVSWYGAHAYCRWQGKRLPTEAEWEKTARGTNGQLYPWGNVWDQGSKTDEQFHLHSVGEEPINVSPYGVYDMLGNAEEWVNDWYAVDYYAHAPDRNPLGSATGDNKVIRSNSSDGAKSVGVLSRSKLSPYSPVAGVRCAYTPK